ncbi:zinc ribbon domain-containing protein [Kribbella sp. NBC_01245]|uniref:RNA-guided endonuclease InsQ/TnpB family protein n=1 Tax=Kribbella sp. NBC_01245 TaxID=2903578 RepID=UPI002E28FE6C|nr:transposase [Kribbella sp. NBC_01245]
MSRYRLVPTPAQETALLGHCGHARYVWNLGLEQRLMWRPGRPPTPGYRVQAAQLTEARAAEPWLAAGSQTVQQQALRDLDQAWRNFFGGTHSRPTWRKEGQHEGFRIVGPQAQRVERLNRKWGRVWVPKAGWIKFRWSRRVPEAKSYRITRDRMGRWHIAFAAIPKPIPAARGTVEAPGRNVAAKAGLNRGILAQGWGLLIQRLEHKATGRVEKVHPAYTSQTCAECGHCASENRENQAAFRCGACGHTANADVNAARNIAAGRAVTARRGTRSVPLKRELHLATSS